MPSLYVTEPGAAVRKSAASLIVTIEDKAKEGMSRRRTLAEIEPHRLELIGLVGRAHITSDAMHVCLEQGVAVAWFTRGGDFKGRLVPEISRTADLRLAQYRLAHEPEAALSVSRSMIKAKLLNGAAVLSAMRANRPGRSMLGDAIQSLRTCASRVANAPGKEVLLGVEGDGARIYFSALSECFSGNISFSGRARRPPPDPANALLSFGYVLLGNMLASLLEGRGFDPYLGMMHSVRSGRPSLALDLLEELRSPLVDRFVAGLCNRRQLQPEHFEPDLRRPGGLRLTRDGLRRFFRAWERHLDSPLAGLADRQITENVVRTQVDRLAAHVRGQQTYQPFSLIERS